MELKEIKTSIDFSSGLMLCIGEQGNSYLPFMAMENDILKLNESEENVLIPVMLQGNYLCIPYGNKLIKKDLLKDVTEEKTVSIEIVQSINSSIEKQAISNYEKISSNEELNTFLKHMLCIGENDIGKELINRALSKIGSEISIKKDNQKIIVSDNYDCLHSLSEVLWMLSFSK